MAIKFEKLQPGMVVHSWGRSNTVMRECCSWPVEIISVDAVSRTVMARWNYNSAQEYTERHLKNWRLKSYYEVQREKKEART